MEPIQPPSKQALLDDQPELRRRPWRGWVAVGILGAVTGWNLKVIAGRYSPSDEGAAAAATAPAATHAAKAATGASAAEAAPVATAALHMAPKSDRAVAYHVVAGRLERNSTVAEALDAAGLTPEQTHDIVHALHGVFDFRYARPGQGFRVKTTPDGQVAFFDYEASPTESYCVRRDGDHLVGYERKIPIRTVVDTVKGRLDSSLYQAMDAAGETPTLAAMLAEVLAWDIDFYRDPRPGDTFEIVVEKHFSKGRFLGYGDILAARYQGAVGTYEVFRYVRPNGAVAYYDQNGKSAQKALLKAPLKFVRITSPYGMRMHPILGYTKMHRGVDYGAPIGTPVMATGEGTVIWAGRKGPNGNMVGLRHANGYTTFYCHLSRILVRRGQRVHQKQIIGRVGETGRATGPHLHYAVKLFGHFLNPLKLKLPPRHPLAKKLMPDFTAHIAPLVAVLDHGDTTKLAAIENPSTTTQ